MMSAATIASLIFFVFSLLAAGVVELLIRKVAEESGVNPWIFAMVPALLAMLYSLLVYQNAERKIHRLGESVSRAILVMLLTWVSFAVMISWTWCQPSQFVSCLGTTLLASGIVGGGPMLLGAIGAGILAGVLIIRKPRPRIE
jgi:hypothetical protein